MKKTIRNLFTMFIIVNLIFIIGAEFNYHFKRAYNNFYIPNIPSSFKIVLTAVNCTTPGPKPPSTGLNTSR